MHGSNILTRYNIQCKVNNGDLLLCTLNFGYIRGTSQHVSQRIVKPYMLQQAALHYKVEFKFKNMIFQSWKEHTFIYQQEDHHESNNLHPTSAEEFRQSARYSSY